MTQLFSKKASLWFRGLAIFMVITSHYAEWWSWFQPTDGAAELLRQALLRLGPYGVAIFFLFSGYGLVKSIGGRTVTFAFLRKRLLAVYLPYLLVAGIIEALTGGFSDAHDFAEFLYGHDYWYMTVLFLFYAGFFCIWLLPLKGNLRVFLFVLYTWAISVFMYQDGRHSFWYISNPAFAVGVLLAMYEPFFKKILDRIRLPLAALLTAGLAVCVRFGLFSESAALWTKDTRSLTELLAVFLWTLWTVCIASTLRRFTPVLPVFGKHSLYLYLSHQFLFWRVIEFFNGDLGLKFFLAALVTAAVSLAFGTAVSALTGRINAWLDSH